MWAVKFILLVKLCIINSAIFCQIFKDVSFQKGIFHNAKTTVGAVVFDIDNDGYDDVFLPGGYYRDSTRFYKNNSGTFVDFTIPSGLSTLNHNDIITISGAAGDLDNDGFKDLVVAKYLCPSDYCNISIYRNNGNNTFSDITSTSNILIKGYNQTISFADINLDGYLDIYVGTYVNGISALYDSVFNIKGYNVNCFPNHLFINNKNLGFTDETNAYGLMHNGCTYSSKLTDFDFDHDVDLMVANDFGEWTHLSNGLYKNNFPDPTFTDISSSSKCNQEMYGMGIATGDYDLDGDLDYYITNIGKNILLKNNSDGVFSNVAGELGIENEWSVVDSSYQTSWGCNFFDADNDGDEDLFVCSGWLSIDLPYTGAFSPNKFYLNNNGVSFSDYSTASGVANPLSHSGSAILDFNNDGKMDIICVSMINPRPFQIIDSSHTILYENVSTTNFNWIKIKLQGIKNARDAFGSRIEVFSNGKKQIREVDGGGGSHSSQSTEYNHFGLGTADNADSIKVYWLGGRVQTVRNIAANQTITILEDTSVLLSTHHKINSFVFSLYPNPVRYLEKIHVSLSQNINTLESYSISDINGRIVFHQTIGQSSKSTKTLLIDLPFTIYDNPGYYFLSLNDFQQNIYTGSFIILK